MRSSFRERWHIGRQFCQNNRGRCEAYCRGKKNALCAAIFPPQPTAVAPRQQAPHGQRSSPPATRACVRNAAPVFTRHFTDPAKIESVSQFGNNAFVNPGAQARSYVDVRGSEQAPVYAPIDATITNITLANRHYSGLTRPEYRLDLEVRCEVRIAFDHITDLAPGLAANGPHASADKTNEGKEVSIPKQAGALIRYTSGTYRGSESGTFDFLLTNTARPHVFLNPARWSSDHSLYQGCVYDYFTPDLKAAYEALLIEENGVRACGPRVREVPGTPLGYWFHGDATEGKGNRFVIYESSHFVEWTLLAGGVAPTAYRDHSPGRVPLASLTAGTGACYADTDRGQFVYLAMLPSDTLALASGAGACPAIFPADRKEIYSR